MTLFARLCVVAVSVLPADMFACSGPRVVRRGALFVLRLLVRLRAGFSGASTGGEGACWSEAFRAVLSGMLVIKPGPTDFRGALAAAVCPAVAVEPCGLPGMVLCLLVLSERCG